MIALNDIRRLLEGALKHGDNPAILRLPERERTVEGVAGAYLPRTLWMLAPTRRAETQTLLESAAWGEGEDGTRPLDLTDPGTAHGLLVALALYLGLDPEEGGLGVMWVSAPRHHPSVWRGDVQVVAEHTTLIWELAARHKVWWASGPSFFQQKQIDLRWIEAPEVAAEPDARKALALAVRRVLS